jgi:hypothetical protein
MTTPPSHTREELVERLRTLYPEIAEHGIDLSAVYDHDKHAWVVRLAKGRHELTTHLEKKDADGCMEGVQCVYLGIQIAQLIKNFEAGS